MTAPLPAHEVHREHLAEVVPLPVRSTPVVPLALAAELTSVSDKLLWVEYLTLGGTADLERFRAHLQQPDPAAAEHEVVLEALEAVLADEDVPVRVR
ncbi:hypothetical protein SAMN03159343_1227 [Klenkia marina]|uniref:Uncharacterized protein n=1 Tax=Klenkia marina TaxID=1960309 RepID=A0A1G4XR14_9ACTN|nr:hypothetical protein [Klenkia marina]SCX43410.1 hypothetical protein SAMN03159343_1227 [Klenkia marina]